MTRKDFKFAIITGLTTGTIAWLIFRYLGVGILGVNSFWFLVILIPALWVSGVWLGYFLGRWINPFRQFGKFVAIGFTNAAIDFGVFNLLFSLSHENKSLFIVFSTISFIVSVTHSYFMNKWWAFEAGNRPVTVGEISRFISVTLLALAVNVGVAYSVFNWVSPLLGMDIKAWANISKVAGSATSLIFSFIGFRLVVFKNSK